MRTSAPVIVTGPPVPALTTAPVAVADPEADEVVLPETPWVTIVWNDPVNLMSYVTYVFRSYFGYSEAVATTLMLDVHHKGRAVVATGSLEEMERHTQAMHEFGLWASVSKNGDGE